MTPTSQFDIEALMVPVSAEHPTGESLRYEGTFDKIRQARVEDDTRLPQGVWKTEPRKAQWSDVETIAVQALTNKTKDLQIAAWLTEAWLKLHGFRGAAVGLSLMHALCEKFWEQMHPAIEGNDL